MKKDKPYLDDSVKRQFDLERVEPPAFIWDNVKETLVDDSRKKVFPFWIILTLCLGFVIDAYVPHRGMDASSTLIAQSVVSNEASSTRPELNTETAKTNTTSNRNETTTQTIDLKSDPMSTIENVTARKSHKNRSTGKLEGRSHDKTTFADARQQENSIAINKGASTQKVMESTAPNQTNTSEDHVYDQPETAVAQTSSSALMTAFEPLDAKDLTLLDTKEVSLFTEKCYSFGKKKRKTYWGIEAYGSGFGNSLLLSSKNGETGYLSRRKATETANFSVGGGLALRLYLNPHWYLRGGVQYQEINTKFNYVNPDEVRVDSAGKIINGTRIKKTTNRLQVVELPLMVGYQQTYGNFSINLSTGAAIGLWQKRKGDILDANEKPISITTGTVKGDSLYRSSTSLSWLLSAAVEYKLTPAHQLFVRPTLQYYLNDFSSAENPIAEKYLHFGLQAGVFVRF